MALISDGFIQMIRTETHRGLEGRALAGFATGGKTYGFTTVVEPNPPQPDHPRKVRVIATEEADIVTRIFEYCAGGMALKKIAALVNEERIPGMALGVITFIGLYTYLDAWATVRGFSDFLRSLRLGVMIKMALQVVPAVELLAGAIAREVVKAMGLQHGFFCAFLMTEIVGVLLSLLLLALTSLVWVLSDLPTVSPPRT